MKAWWESLPPEIVAEIKAVRKEAGIGSSTIASWLKSIGYEDATSGKVDTLLGTKR